MRCARDFSRIHFARNQYINRRIYAKRNYRYASRLLRRENQTHCASDQAHRRIQRMILSGRPRPLSLALHWAHMLIQKKLQALDFTHLSVRIQDSNFVIYSIEYQNEAHRAILTRFRSNEYMLCIANHRGNWQPTPFIGTLSELMAILTGRLAFVLARWH